MKTIMCLIAGVVIAVVCLGLLIYNDFVERDQMVKQLTAISTKMNCVPIEQSYRSPDKFYVYCGNDVYKVVDLSNHEELFK